MPRNYIKRFKRVVLLSAAMATAVVGFVAVLRFTPVNAAVGINEQINYQGRLLTGTGAVVPDGTYNMEFKIVKGGDGCNPTSGTFPCSGTAQWTETRESSNKVLVKNGYFSVYLGAITPFSTSVDWNDDTLWLAINVGGTGAPSYDGVMKPLTRLSSTPYALNSRLLGGRLASEFLQLSPSAAQSDTSSNASIFVDDTGGGNLIQLQASSTNMFLVDGGGNTTIAGNLTVQGTGTNSFGLGATGVLAVNGASSTSTGGVIDLNVNSLTANNIGLNIDYASDDTAAANVDLFAQKITISANDADADLFGLYIQAANTANAAANSYSAGLWIDNADQFANSMSDAILITSTGGPNGVTDAIDVSNSNITNALNVGDNIITGTNGVINFTDFDLDADGKLTLHPDTAGDAISVTLSGAADLQALVVNATSIDSTQTAGVIDLNIDTSTNNAIGGMALDLTVVSDNGADTIYGNRTNLTVADDVGASGTDTAYAEYINLTVTDASSTGYGLYVDAGTGAGTEYAAVFLNGNVGIGTASPATLLQIGDGTNDAIMTFTDTGAAVQSSVDFQSGGLSDPSGSDGWKLRLWGAGAFEQGDYGLGINSNTIWINTAGTDIDFYDNGSLVGTFQNGNFGIGDADPAAMLTVGNGDLFQVVSTGHVRTVAGSSTTPSYSFTSDTDTGMYSGGDNILLFSTGDSQKLTIDGTSTGGMTFNGGTGANQTGLTIQRGRDDDANSILNLQNTSASTNLTVADMNFMFTRSTGGAALRAARILSGEEMDWTSTTSTQDSYLSFQTALDGTVGERARVKSDGTVQLLAYNCSAQTNGGALTTDSSGNLTCSADDGGGSSVTAGNDIDVTAGQIDIEPQLDFVSTISQASASLTLQTTTSGNIIFNSAGTIELQDNTNITGNLDISGTFTSGSSDQLTIDASGNLTTSGTLTITNATTDITSASGQNLTLVGGGTGSVVLNDIVGIPALSSANNDSVLCRNSLNALANCSSTFATTTTAFLQGGNSFTATAVLGTNDSNSLAFETGGTTRWTISTAGIFESSGAQSIQTSTGNLTVATGGGNGNIILSPNGTGNVGIGTTTPGEKLEVVGNIISKGTEWTSRTSPADSNWISVAYGNGLFVAVADDSTSGDVMTSPDGIVWTARTDAGSSWKSVSYGNGLFVAVGSSGAVMTSPDGITWTARTAASSNDWQAVTYGNGLFAAVSNTGTGTRIMTSPNGINWTTRSGADDNSWAGITYGHGTFVATSVSSTTGATKRVMTSPDGYTWTMRDAATSNQWNAVTYGNGTFVAVSITGTNNRAMTSPDGITWTSRTSAANSGWRNVTYGNGLFVAVANDGTGVMTSPDGITWTTRTASAGNFWTGLTYGNGMFVATAQSGTGNRVMTSGKADYTITPVKSLAVQTANTSTTGDVERTLNVVLADTGIVTTGTDTTYGGQITVSRTGATGGTINTFGLDIQATADNAGAGTSTLTGLNVNVSGADTNYAALFQGGNVGIGEATPQALLHVDGTVRFEDFTTCTLTTDADGDLVCGAGGGSNTLQQAYDADSDGSDALITLTSTDGAIKIRDASTTLAGTLFAVQNNAGTVDYLKISTGTTTGITVTGSTSVGNVNVNNFDTSITNTGGLITSANKFATSMDFASAASQSIFSVNGNLTYSVSNANNYTGNGIGVYGNIDWRGSGNSSGSRLDGVRGSVISYASSGTIQNAAAVSGGFTFNGGSVATAQGFLFNDPGGSSAITDLYGIRIGSLTRGTNNYAIYTEGTTQSIFGGSVGVGSTTSPTDKLTIQNSSGSAGITINGVGTNVTPRLGFAREGTLGSVIGETDILNGFFNGAAVGDLAIRTPNGQKIHLGIDNGAGTGNPTITLSAGNVGIGDTTPAAMLTVGNGDLFQVSSTGLLTMAPATFTAPSIAATIGVTSAYGTDLGLQAGDTQSVRGNLTINDSTAGTTTPTIRGFTNAAGRFSTTVTNASIGSQGIINGVNGRIIADSTAGNYGTTLTRGYSAVLGEAYLGKGNLTNLAGVASHLQAGFGSNTGTITNGYGFLASSPQENTGTITNYYGLYLESAGSNATNPFGIYQAGTSDRNYFAGNTGMGSGATTADELLHLAKSTDGDQVLFLLENSQANASSSTNETAQVRFGFGTNNDVARFVVGKEGDYTTGANEDSFMAFYTDLNGTATERLRIKSDGTLQLLAYNCSGQTNGGTLTTDASGNVTCAADDGGGGTVELDTAYNADTDKHLTVDSTSGLTFDMTTTGDVMFEDSGSAFFTINDTGSYSFTLDGTDNPAYTITNNGSNNVITNLAGTGDYVIQDNGTQAFFISDTGAVFLGKADGGVNVTIGDGSASTTPDLFVLDIKSDSGDPSGTEGAMYYNDNTNKFRCFEGAAWKDCDTTGGGATYVVIGANVASTASTAYQNITNMSWTLAANTRYEIECQFRYDTSAATIGIGIGWTGPASPNFAHGNMISGIGTQTVGGTTVTGNDTGATTTASVGATNDNLARFNGFWSTGGTGGTLQMRFKPETATANGIVILSGSWCKYSTY